MALKVASQAVLCYNKDLKMFDPSGAGNTLESELHLNRGEANGYSILISSALQADPLSFPLLNLRRKILMAPRKGTPEYDAWKNSPEYAERNRLISEAKKGKLFSAQAKKNMSAAQRSAYAALTDEEKENRRATNNLVTGKGEIWRGRHHTDETKAKLADQRIGKSPINKGQPMSDEQRKKLSDAAQKRPPRSPESLASFIAAGHKSSQTPEARAKQSMSLRGHPVSDETKKKIKAKRKGQPPTFLGKTHTDEAKAKMSVSTSIAQKSRYAAMSVEDRAHLAVKRMATIPMHSTSIENFVADQLDRLGIAYIRQKQFWYYIVDFFLPDFDLVIEVNGCYWHCCDQCGHSNAHGGKREKDTKRYEYLTKRGYSVGIIWEHDLLPLMKTKPQE